MQFSGLDLGFLEEGGGLIQSTNLCGGDVLQYAKHPGTRGLGHAYWYNTIGGRISLPMFIQQQ